MFAIIETGGKQYKVEKGTKIEIEKLPDEAGKTVKFSEVLLTSDGKTTKIGKPYVEGAEVTAKVLELIKGKKITILKKKPKKRYERKIGHRQLLTIVEVTEVKG